MHTARLLTVSPSMHCAGGMPGPGVPGSGGCLVGGGGHLLWTGWVILGDLLWGVPGPGGGILACTEADSSL